MHFLKPDGGSNAVEHQRCAQEVAKRDVSGYYIGGFGYGESMEERPDLLNSVVVQQNQRKPTYVEFFRKVHRRRDGSWVDIEIERHVVNVDEALASFPQETRDTPEVVKEVYEKEFEDRLIGNGRVFGYGVGVRPEDVGYSTPLSFKRRANSGTSRLEVESIQVKLEASETHFA